MLGKQRGDRAPLLYLGKAPSLGCTVGGAPACWPKQPACRVALILTEAEGSKCLFSPFPPVPSFRALAYFCPIAVPVACVCMSGEHGFDIHPTGGFVLWVQWMMDWFNGSLETGGRCWRCQAGTVSVPETVTFPWSLCQTDLRSSFPHDCSCTL